MLGSVLLLLGYFLSDDTGSRETGVGRTARDSGYARRSGQLVNDVSQVSDFAFRNSSISSLTLKLLLRGVAPQSATGARDSHVPANVLGMTELTQKDHEDG